MPDAAAQGAAEPVGTLPQGPAPGGDSDADADAVERESAFSHPVVPPDATASYGDHPDQLIDFFAPDGGAQTAGGVAPDEGAPLVVLVHGGAWRARYDRRHMSPLAAFLTRRGFAVASVEYRRGGEPADEVTEPSGPDEAVPPAGRWPDTFDDIAAAFDALPALVRTALPGADPRRTVLVGHSAGGHLALWAAARHVLPKDSPWRTERPAELRGVVALAPVADLALAIELGICSGAPQQVLGGPEHTGERLPYADPAALLPTGIATTLVQGRTDVVVPHTIAESYAAAAAKAGEVVGLTLLEDVGHFPLIDPVADACAVVAEEIAQLAW